MATVDINNDDNSESFYTEEDELLDYILNLDDSNVKEMLSKKKLPIWDYKSKENKNSSALNISVYKKSFIITKLLIDYCKTENPEKLNDFINSPNDQGISPIHYASFKGDVSIIKLLMENGADINKITKRKLNVIHYSAQGNKPNSLMYFYIKLKEKNENDNKYKLIKDIDGGGSTSLHWAVYSLAEDFLLYLINLDIFDSEKEKYNFINKLDNDGNSALHLSVSSKSSRIALRLLQNGADSLLINKKGETPLQLAINKNQNDIIRLLKNNQRCQICNIRVPSRQIKKSNKNIFYVFAFQIISILIMLFSILPIVINKYYNIFGAMLFLLYILMLSLFFILYLILIIRDPGQKKKNYLADLTDLLNKNSDLTKYCYKCFIKKEKTSKHCIICDNCYENFDHHCYWINKCVAKRNYSLFIFFLFETAIYLIIILLISILSLINIRILKKNIICKIHNSWINDICEYIFKEDKLIFHLIINILLILIILSFLIPEFLLLILHIHVCLTNYKEEKKRQNSTCTTTNSLLNDDNSLYISNN